jgi:hypothetical protein
MISSHDLSGSHGGQGAEESSFLLLDPMFPLENIAPALCGKLSDFLNPGVDKDEKVEGKKKGI